MGDLARAAGKLAWSRVEGHRVAVRMDSTLGKAAGGACKLNALYLPGPSHASPGRAHTENWLASPAAAIGAFPGPVAAVVGMH